MAYIYNYIGLKQTVGSNYQTNTWDLQRICTISLQNWIFAA